MTRRRGGREVPPAAPAATSEPESRPTPLRLAGLHLRMGSLALARAELEALAGRSMLDEPAMLDLAEVRWRTGDLAGAGEAANAVLGRGREDALALVIAAEAVASLGRPGEARRLAARATEASGGSLDAVFAGIPRSAIWPDAGSLEAPAGTEAAASRLEEDEAPPPASTGAAEAFAGGRAALGSGNVETAAVRLGVALRLEPGYAKDVLEAVAHRDEPSLVLVAGDALRLLGRETEALAAFDRARGHEVEGPDESDEAPGDDRANDPAPGAVGADTRDDGSDGADPAAAVDDTPDEGADGGATGTPPDHA